MAEYKCSSKEKIIMEKEKRLSKSTIKSMGFSDKLIKQLLPEPILVNNPYYKCAPQMQLWLEKDVLTAMKKNEFVEYQKTRELRSKKALETANKKKEETLKLVNGFLEKITIKKISKEKLWELTIEDKLFFENNIRSGCEYYTRAEFESVDEETRKRWMRNYVRHNLTSYDYDLENLYKKIGKQEAYEYFKEELMKKIKKVYPKLF